MPPLCPHSVVTFITSLCLGCHGHAKATLEDSLLGDIHMVFTEDFTSNTSHYNVRNELVIIGLYQLRAFLERQQAEWSHHILRLVEPRDLRAFMHLVAFVVLFPALNTRDYVTKKKKPFRLRIHRPVFEQVVHFWTLLGEFESRFDNRHFTSDRFESFSDALDVRQSTLAIFIEF